MKNNIEAKLLKFGLSREEASVLIFIVEKNEVTASEIRKALAYGASKVNKILNSLKRNRLVKEEASNGLKLFSIEDLQNLSLLVKEKSSRLEALQSSTSDVFRMIEKMSAKSSLDAKVIHYSELDGLKQVMWNTLQAEDELRFYVSPDMGEYLDFDFYDEIRRIYVEKGIRTRELLNVTSYPEFTEVTEFLKLFKVRYIDPKLIELRYEILVYNNVCAMYLLTDGGLFCFEIYNDKMATMQKQIYDFVWNRAQRLEVYTDRGGIRLAK